MRDNAMFDRLGVVVADGSVKHAVLIFDERGQEAYRYVGEVPLPDLDEIPAALTRMSRPIDAVSPAAAR